MLKPQFLLTHKIPVEITRTTADTYVDGDPVPGTSTTFTTMVNIQPVKPYEILMVPESDRTRSWWKVYSADVLRTLREGVDGWSADTFQWKGDTYKVMRVDDWTSGMSILEHTKSWCVRLERTPN
jgi:hypothetical protein